MKYLFFVILASNIAFTQSEGYSTHLKNACMKEKSELEIRYEKLNLDRWNTWESQATELRNLVISFFEDYKTTLLERVNNKDLLNLYKEFSDALDENSKETTSTSIKKLIESEIYKEFTPLIAKEVNPLIKNKVIMFRSAIENISNANNSAYALSAFISHKSFNEYGFEITLSFGHDFYEYVWDNSRAFANKYYSHLRQENNVSLHLTYMYDVKSQKFIAKRKYDFFKYDVFDRVRKITLASDGDSLNRIQRKFLGKEFVELYQGNNISQGIELITSYIQNSHSRPSRFRSFKEFYLKYKSPECN